MIVCSCNVLSDSQIVAALTKVERPTITVGQIYSCLGCRPRCGQCAPTIKKLRDECTTSRTRN
jgi:bacterioferritin-associated ferredoxin